MLKTLIIAATVAVAVTSLAGSAEAFPAAPVKQIAVENHLILVRDGCGPGMRFSNRRDRCIGKSGRSQRFRDSRPPDRDMWRHRRHHRSDSEVGADVIHGIFGDGRRHRY